MKLLPSTTLLCAAYLLQQQSATALAPSSNSNRKTRIHTTYTPPSSEQQADVSFSSSSSSRLYMKQPKVFKDDKTRKASDLYAFAISSEAASTYEDDNSFTMIPSLSFLQSFLFPVLSTSLLITSNTVGASMLVLPELAAGPGMSVSSAVFAGAYVMNLISGLTIAQVAIQQHETSGSDVPSSFKEFAESSLPSAANLVSGISIFVNSLVLAFDTTKAGQVLGSSLMASSGLDLGPDTVSYLWAAGLVAIISTQSLKNLSQVASMLVMGLFASFAFLLLPGLANVADPMAVLTAPPDASVDVMAQVIHMTPVIVSSLVFQNIIPTATRILEYDRLKITTAITLGSFLPLCMYLAWCVAALGGGLDPSSMGMAGPLLTLFSIVTVAGSSIGALMSLSGEFEILLGQEKKDTFSLSSVALPAGVALLACQIFASDITGALKVAGSFGSPLLYGLIPVTMAWMQLQNLQKGGPSGVTAASGTSLQEPPSSVVPGGTVGLGVLGLGAGALVSVELAETASHLL